MKDGASLDRRLNPYRDDIAGAHLRGEVAASRFVDGVDRQVVVPSVPLLRRPETNAPMETQLVYGETFRVYEEKGGWAWGQSAHDDYVGYADAKSLSARLHEVTHTVAVLRTFIFPKADIKSRPVIGLPMNAKLRVVSAQGSFSVLARGGYVFTGHLAPLGVHAQDVVTVAEQFEGVPYLWGGRDSLGIDCSGLVQTCLERAGISSLRDTDMQETALGEPLPLPVDFAKLRRGDLVYWKGHVGIMRDREDLIHANAAHMRVAIEPLSEAVARIGKNGTAISSVKRLARR